MCVVWLVLCRSVDLSHNSIAGVLPTNVFMDSVYSAVTTLYVVAECGESDGVEGGCS
jgi:hypothetical protein